MAQSRRREHELVDESDSDYNADDSDNESLVDVSSPADGYFEQRQHPQQRFVENSRVGQDDEVAKEREAEEERRINNASIAARQPPQPSASTRPPAWAEGPTQILDAGPAPPDYEAATADRRNRGQSQGDGSGRIDNGTFSPDHPLVRNGILGEEGTWSSRNEPESMRDTAPRQPQLRGGGGSEQDDADAEQQATEETALIGLYRAHKAKKRRWKKRLRQCCLLRNWLLAFAIIILLGVLVEAIRWIWKENRNSNGGNGRGNQPSNPARPPDGPTPPHPHSKQCPYDSFSETITVEYNSPWDFTFLDVIEEIDRDRDIPYGGSITGTVKIEVGPNEQRADLVVSVNIALANRYAVTAVNYASDDTSFRILFPALKDQPEKCYYGCSEACMDIAVAIQVRPGADFVNWTIDTKNMGIKIECGLFEYLKNGTPKMTITDTTDFYAPIGGVNSCYWKSRETYVWTSSGKIEGDFALRDVLSLKTKSGSVGVVVDPKEEDKQHPAPAILKVNSSSGKVKTKFQSNQEIPERIYQTSVRTSSSSISGSYLLGASAEFCTNSGKIDIDVTPYSSNFTQQSSLITDKKENLITDTQSGHTTVRLGSPYTEDSFSSQQSLAKQSSSSSEQKDNKHFEGIIDRLRSRHSSHSGGMDLEYADEWEGTVDVQTWSGGIKLRGHGLKKVAEWNLPAIFKTAIGRKGIGRSMAKVRTRSGGVDFLAGEDCEHSHRC